MLKKIKKVSVILILLVLGCNKQNTDIKLINNFIGEVVLSKNGTYKESSRFIGFDKKISKEKKEVFNLFIDENIKFLRKELINNKYVVVSNDNLKDLDINFIYKIQNLEKVYHLVSNDKVVTTFIIKNGKIISFFYNIVKGNSKKRTPLMLNK